MGAPEGVLEAARRPRSRVPLRSDANGVVPANHDLPTPPGAGNCDARAVAEFAGLRTTDRRRTARSTSRFPYEWDEREIGPAPSPSAT